MEQTVVDVLMADFAGYVDFMVAYNAYQDSKVVDAVEDAYWTDMEALELSASEDAYYRSFQ